MGQTTEKLWKVAKISDIQKKIDYYMMKNNDLIQEEALVQERIKEVKQEMGLRKRSSKPDPSAITLGNQFTGSKKDQSRMNQGGVLITSNYKPEVEVRSYQSELNSAALAYETTKTTLVQVENKKGKKLVDLSSLVSHNKYMIEKINELRREIRLQNQIVQNLDREKSELGEEINSMEKKIDDIRKTGQRVFLKYNEKLHSHKQNTRDMKMRVKEIKQDLHRSNIRNKQNRKEGSFEEGTENSDDEMNPHNMAGSLEFYMTGASISNKRGMSPDIERPGVVKDVEGLCREKRMANEKTREEIQEMKEVLDNYYAALGATRETPLGELLDYYGVQSEEYRVDNNQATSLLENLDNLRTLKDTINLEIRLVQENRLKHWRKRDDAIAHFEKHILITKEKIESLAKTSKDTQTLIFSIKIAILEIFRKIGCEPPKNSLYETHDINDENVLDYLTIIEQRANEIITLYNDVRPSDPNNNKSSHNTLKKSDPKMKKDDTVYFLTENQNRDIKNYKPHSKVLDLPPILSVNDNEKGSGSLLFTKNPFISRLWRK